METFFVIIDAHSHTNHEVRALPRREEEARSELGSRCDVLDVPLERVILGIGPNERRKADREPREVLLRNEHVYVRMLRIGDGDDRGSRGDHFTNAHGDVEHSDRVGRIQEVEGEPLLLCRDGCLCRSNLRLRGRELFRPGSLAKLLQLLLQHPNLGARLCLRRFQIRDQRPRSGRFFGEVTMPVELALGVPKGGSSTIQLRHGSPHLLDAWSGIDERRMSSRAGQIGFASTKNRQLGCVVENGDPLPLVDHVSSVEANLLEPAADSKSEVSVVVLDDALVTRRRLQLRLAPG